MRKVNKILALFLFVVVITMIGVWNFLQSDTLGRQLSRVVSKLAYESVGVRLKFDHMDFQMFPPGANLNNLKLTYENSQVDTEIEIRKVGIYFDLMDIFRTDFRLSEVYIEDALINLKKLKLKGEEQAGEGDKRKSAQEAIEGYMEQAHSFSQKLRTRRLHLRDFIVRHENEDYRLAAFSLAVGENGLETTLDVRNISTKVITSDIHLPERLRVPERLDQLKLKIGYDQGSVRLESLELNQGLLKLSLDGFVGGFDPSSLLRLKGEIRADVTRLSEYIDINKIDWVKEGFLEANFFLKGSISDPTLNANVKLKNLDSDFFYAENANLEFGMNREKVILEKLSIASGEQMANLIHPVEVFDLKNKRLTLSDALIKVENLEFNNFLRALRKTLKPLNGKVSGLVKISFTQGGVLISPENNARIDNLQLDFSAGERPIINVQRMSLHDSKFSVSKKGVFRMFSKIKMSNSEFGLVGMVEGEEIAFKVDAGHLDFADLGPIAGLEFLGAGNFSLKTSGRGKNIKLELTPELKGFSFQGYNFQNIKAKATIDFSKSLLSLEKVRANYGQTFLEGKLALNYGNLDVHSNAIVKGQHYGELKKILEPLLGEYHLFTDEIMGNWSFQLKARGKATLEELKLAVLFEGVNNYILDESFDKARFDLTLEDSTLSLNDIGLYKAEGAITGSLKYFLKNKGLAFKFNADRLRPEDFAVYAKLPLNFESLMSAQVIGDFGPAGRRVQALARLDETKVAGLNYASSELKFELLNESLKYEISALGEEIRSKGELLLDGRDKKSALSLNINIEELEKSAALLRFVDRSQLQFEGKLRLNSTAEFRGLNYKELDFTLNLEEFLLNKGNVQVAYESSFGRQIVVSDGTVENWNVELPGNNFRFISKASGNFSGHYDLKSELLVDASVLEIFNTLITRSSGIVSLRTHFYDSVFSKDHQVSAISDDLKIALEGVPVEANKIDVNLQYRNKKLLFEKFKAALTTGSIGISGMVDFSKIVPGFNLQIQAQDVGVPILKKSSMIFDADLSLAGISFPYSLSGDVDIKKLLLTNEIADFNQYTKRGFKTEYNYLPEQGTQRGQNYLSMDVGVKTLSPMQLSNSMADISILGRANVTGTEDEPKVSGSFSLAPRQSKVSFKNNDYVMSKANVFFYEKEKPSNPSLDITAQAEIDDYKVNIKVYGPVQDFKVELSSEPTLTQEDILSLIAFGYTEDLSQNLSEEERESMTRAGVGAIIFDSFKINETLKNEFGLQVNLGTQITEENRSYLSRVNSDPSASRVTSATTVEIKKKISDAMDLSVSSTVGGGIGQRQSMNLNYNISNKIAVEGVYETLTSDQGEETINDTSLGADLKFRWSFK